jgi:hypothetical protein
VTLLTASPTPVLPAPETGADAEGAGIEEEIEVDVAAVEEERPVTTSPPPMLELGEGDAVEFRADEAVVMTEGSAETGAVLAPASAEAVELASEEGVVVTTDGSPDTGAELDAASAEVDELSDAIEVTAADALSISDTAEVILLCTTLDSSRPVEVELPAEEAIDVGEGAVETVPFPAIPECDGLLHLPRPCPAT